MYTIYYNKCIKVLTNHLRIQYINEKYNLIINISKVVRRTLRTVKSLTLLVDTFLFYPITYYNNIYCSVNFTISPQN